LQLILVNGKPPVNVVHLKIHLILINYTQNFNKTLDNMRGFNPLNIVILNIKQLNLYQNILSV